MICPSCKADTLAPAEIPKPNTITISRLDQTITDLVCDDDITHVNFLECGECGASFRLLPRFVKGK